jgi:hypothetical protein
VLGALVLRCPQITFARDALDQLRVACDLFGRVYAGFSAEKVYVSAAVVLARKAVLTRIVLQDKMIIARDKAEASLSEYITGTPQLGLGPGAAESDDTDDDVLSHLGARTRTIARGESAQPRNGSGSVGTPSEPSESSPGHAEPVVPLPLSAGAAQGYHPQVLQYLRTLSPAVQVRGLDLSQMPPATAPAWNGQQAPQGPYAPAAPLQHAPGQNSSLYGAVPAWPSHTGLPPSASYGQPQERSPATSSPSYPYSYERGGPLAPVAEHGEPQPLYQQQQQQPYHTGPSSLAYGYPQYPGAAQQPTPSSSFDDPGALYAAGYQHYDGAPAPAAYGHHPGAHISFAQPPARPGPAMGGTSTEWNQLMSQMYPPQ